jgi:hypothetical protein
LATDSRVTLTGQRPNSNLLVEAHYDNTTKLLKVRGQDFVGAVTYGLGALGGREPRTAHSYLPEFETELATEERLSVEEFAARLGDFFQHQWNAANTPVEKSANDFGITFGGQAEIAGRLLNGYDPQLENLVRENVHLNPAQTANLRQKVLQRLAMPIPYQFLPLQDCVDLAIFVSTTRHSRFVPWTPSTADEIWYVKIGERILMLTFVCPALHFGGADSPYGYERRHLR